jgi:hypothetical protein
MGAHEAQAAEHGAGLGHLGSHDLLGAEAVLEQHDGGTGCAHRPDERGQLVVGGGLGGDEHHVGGRHRRRVGVDIDRLGVDAQHPALGADLDAPGAHLGGAGADQPVHGVPGDRQAGAVEQADGAGADHRVAARPGHRSVVVGVAEGPAHVDGDGPVALGPMVLTGPRRGQRVGAGLLEQATADDVVLQVAGDAAAQATGARPALRSPPSDHGGQDAAERAEPGLHLPHVVEQGGSQHGAARLRVTEARSHRPGHRGRVLPISP